METESSSVLMSTGGVGGPTPLVGAMQNERQVVRKAGRQAIRQFLEQHNCFSVLRSSGKVVVFDTRIPIQLAFYALVEHGTLALVVLLLNSKLNKKESDDAVTGGTQRSLVVCVCWRAEVS